MKLSKIISAFIYGVFAIFLVSKAQATCLESQALPTFADRKIRLVDDSLMFSVAALAMDIDGAKSAYGVSDQGLENVCNGLSALSPEQCAGKPARGLCFTACQSAYKSWYAGGHEPERIGSFMCSIGLGGGGCSPPLLRLQDSPRTEWFVSETSLKLKVGEGQARRSQVVRQSAQLDAVEIPYFVIPGRFRAKPWDATPGDVGVIIRANDGHMVKFVVGDTGGSLDEASARLLADLYQSPLVTSNDSSALGDKVKRLHPPQYSGNRDFRVAIFRHSGTYKAALGSTKVLDKFSNEVVPWINKAVDARVERLGGPGRIVECTDPATR